jgi:transcription elongation GreA/GreB family factor
MIDSGLKNKLLVACRTKLMASIQNLEAAMNDAQQQANDYGPPRDRYDAFRTQLMRKRDMMAQQLDAELNELKILDRIDPNKTLEVIGFGAVILSNSQNCFIAVSQGKIEVEGKLFFSISAKVPLFQALQGKRKGDIIDFRGNKIEIIDIL